MCAQKHKISFCCGKEGQKHEYIGALSVKKKYVIMFLILRFQMKQYVQIETESG